LQAANLSLQNTKVMQKETLIYLEADDRSKWQPFKLSDSDELVKRGIFIAGDAVIRDCVKIENNVQIFPDAIIGMRAVIGAWSRISHSADIGPGSVLGKKVHIRQGAKVGQRANIGMGATISVNAIIPDYAWIAAGAHPKTFSIAGSCHPVLYWGENNIKIGCEVATIEEWEDIYQEVGEEENYTPEQIAEYFGYIQIVKAFHAANSLSTAINDQP
jgi:tetrahydrodipicolinate N-succinyltransferase